MESQRILRLQRSDLEDDSFVLINVSADGAHPLDLTLVATEGESPYVVHIRQRNIKKLRAQNYHGDDQEFQAALSHVLLREPLDDGYKTTLTGLQAVCSLNENGSLNIAVRISIGGIHQRLGTIEMKQDDDQEIALFDWTGLAVKSGMGAEVEMQKLQNGFEEQKATIQRLHDQLEELIAAKKEHEEQLLEKFKALLNAKKLKIRDQQRLLAGVQVDPAAATHIKASRDTGIRSESKEKGRGKRKRPEPQSPSPEPVEETVEDEEEPVPDDDERQTETETETEDGGDGSSGDDDAETRANLTEAAAGRQDTLHGDIRERPSTINRTVPITATSRDTFMDDDDETTDDEL